MAVVLGTNAGFVTTAPTSDPDGSITGRDDFATSMKDTAPIGATKIVEIGWWCDNATEESNFEVGIYDHNSGSDKPENLLSGVDRTNAKGTGAGWKKVTGLNISITAETIYWIGLQLDNTSTTTNFNLTSDSGRNARLNPVSTLPDPWGVYSGTSSIIAIYALIETGSSATDNMNIIGENVY